jgi:hypothetical protein
MRTALQLASAVVATVSLAGCAGVFNPYVRPANPDKHPFRENKTTLPEALTYADTVRAEYRAALTNQGRLTTGLGAVLIPLTGVVAYQGIAGASASAIAATSIGGAALLGTGMYLYSAPRQIIYAEASAAISCAIGIVGPLQLPGNESQQLDMAVDFTLPKMLAATSGVPTSDALTLTQQIRTALEAGREVRAIIHDAGPQLITAVDSIIDKTDKQISTTVPDPRVLATGLGGLVPVPKVGAIDIPTLKPSTGTAQEAASVPPPPPSPLEVALRAAGFTLQQVHETLAFVAGIVNRVKDISLRTALTGCGTALDNVVTVMRLIPESSAITFAAGIGGEHVAVITGGKPRYFADVLKKPSKGSLTAEVLSEVAGYQLRVRVDTAVPVDEYAVVVRDSSSADPRLLTVKVQK